MEDTPASIQDCRPQSHAVSHFRALSATLLGNFMETFDLAIYVYMASTIGYLFFPPGAPTATLLMSLSTIAVGMITRPLGSLFFGPYADRFGRRAGLTLSLACMGCGTLMVACAPTYAAQGMLAPAMLVTARLIQSFAAGGETGMAVTAVVEMDPLKGRALRGGLESASAGAGALSGALVTLLVHRYLSTESLHAWGWRVPFLIGLLIAPAGILLRRSLADDAPSASVPRRRMSSVLTDLMKYRRELILFFLIHQGGAVCYQALAHYVPTHAIAILALPKSAGLWIAVLTAFTLTVAPPFGGFVVEKWGRRKPVLLTSRLIVALLLPPFFWLINRHPTLSVIMPSAFLMTLIYALSGSVASVLLAEAFPRSIRATAVSLTIALAVALMGWPFHTVAIASIALTGQPLAPAFYAMVCLLVSVWAISRVAETGLQPLRED